MIRIREDRQTLSTIILFVQNKNVTIKRVSFRIINWSSCIIQIGIRQNFANFTPPISKNATIKVFARLPIPKIK